MGLDMSRLQDSLNIMTLKNKSVTNITSGAKAHKSSIIQIYSPEKGKNQITIYGNLSRVCDWENKQRSTSCVI